MWGRTTGTIELVTPLPALRTSRQHLESIFIEILSGRAWCQMGYLTIGWSRAGVVTTMEVGTSTLRDHRASSRVASPTITTSKRRSRDLWMSRLPVWPMLVIHSDNSDRVPGDRQASPPHAPATD